MSTRPRIRTLKPELWADERIGRLDPWERLLYVGLITMADDDGRLRALPAAITGHVFPYDVVTPKRITGSLERLNEVGLVDYYEVAEVRYVQIRGWEKHQKIYKKTPSSLPDYSRNGSGIVQE